MVEVGFAGAFLGGLLTLVSPCAALLLPSFLAVAFDGIGRLLLRSVLFFVGASVVLVPLGAGVGAFSSLLTEHRGVITTVSGVVLIVMGLLVVFGRGFSVLPGVKMGEGRHPLLGMVVLGGTYGLAGFCSGPLLGSVLTFALAGGSPRYGALLMVFYALGMSLPLFSMVLWWDRLRLGQRRWLRGRELQLGRLRFHSTQLISGVLFTAIGVLFIATEGTANLASVMGVEKQFQLQVWASNLASSIPDFVLPLLVFTLVAVVLLVRRVLRARNQES